MKLTKLITITLGTALLLAITSGCSSLRNLAIEDSIKNTKDANDTQKVKKFEKIFAQVLDDIENKKDYQKLPTGDTDKTRWLIKESFKLWDKQITKDEYITASVEKYNGYKETLSYLADEFSK